MGGKEFAARHGFFHAGGIIDFSIFHEFFLGGAHRLLFLNRLNLDNLITL